MRKRFLKYFLMLIGVCGIVTMCSGQVVVTFNPAIYGQTMDGLALAQVMNSSGGELRGFITIRVRENGGGK
ncbi:hypothetical protein [Paraflavitalea speifideaquila]|uniref:hypothetical protein n=1 Tax=Paraflavitalea speifideaquila TaxID=3076558 RepID=UPI0028E59B04|nr:hypothetical protein [Paraflavitalea speifideiaquila]